MPDPVDLATFKPQSIEDMFEGLLSHVIPVIGGGWNDARAEIETHLRVLAKKSFTTAQQLASGAISIEDADFVLHGQELYFNNILLYSEFLTYELAQKVLDAVFGVVKAAISNWTGFELNF